MQYKPDLCAHNCIFLTQRTLNNPQNPSEQKVYFYFVSHMNRTKTLIHKSAEEYIKFLQDEGGVTDLSEDTFKFSVDASKYLDPSYEFLRDLKTGSMYNVYVTVGAYGNNAYYKPVAVEYVSDNHDVSVFGEEYSSASSATSAFSYVGQ